MVDVTKKQTLRPIPQAQRSTIILGQVHGLQIILFPVFHSQLLEQIIVIMIIQNIWYLTHQVIQINML